MKLEILVVFAVIAALQAATPKPTHEPNEYESLSFFYNRNTQSLILKESSKTYFNCYVQSLTDAQKVQVHTDHGLKMLELAMLGQTSTASMVSSSMLNPLDILYVWSGNDDFEREYHYYFYFPVTTKFFVSTYTPNTMNCYVVTLTDNEKLAVHTDEGMRAIEIKSLSNLVSAVPVKPEDLDQRDVNMCYSVETNRTVAFFKIE